MDNQILPLIELKGTPREIGLKHGKELKDRILRAIEYYHSIFDREEDEIFKAASHFRKVIKDFNNDYAIEIESIAEGAEVDPLWIYALNSRTEILTLFVTECTAFYFSEPGILSQNWDWSQTLETLMVLMKITRVDEHTILQITEPGIIGKIGMNSSGLGVTLNFLHMDRKLSGLPIHIVLRHFLDSKTLEEGEKNLGEFKYGKSSNIIFASSNGKFINFEFADDKVHTSKDGKYFLHTNHFLKDKVLNDAIMKIESSLERYSKASGLVTGEQSVEKAKEILANKDNTQLPICRPYIPHESIGDVGTVTTIIMDLKNLKIHATRGNPFENEFEIFPL